MSTYILIHGAWHGGWCWHKVSPLLEAQGHTVLTPDLPGLGDDPMPVAQVSLRAYRDSICTLLDAQSTPAILVGHSMGGAVLSLVAEARPDKVATLVYLTAMLVEDGNSLLDVALRDEGSQVLINIVPSEDETCAMVKPEALREVFYARCTDTDIEHAAAKLRPQAMGVMNEPIRVTEINWGRVPRVYIECLRDRAITAEAQRRMYGALPCHKVLTLDTDHSPFFSMPGELSEQLAGLSS